MNKIKVGDKVKRTNPQIIDAWKTGKVIKVEENKVWLDYCPPFEVKYTNNPIKKKELKKIN